MVGDVVDGRYNIAVSVDFEVSFRVHMKATEVENELIIQENPDIIVAAKPKLFRTIGSDFHRDAHMGSEMEVVALASSSVGVREVDVVKRKSSLATVFVGVVTITDEGYFAIVLLGKLFAASIVGFVKPTIEIIGGLDGVVSGDISSKNVVVGVPGILCISKSWNWEAVIAESALYDVTDNSLRVEATLGPLELAVGGITVILALIPVSNRDGNAVWVAERSGLPRGRDTVFVGDCFERHSAYE